MFKGKTSYFILLLALFGLLVWVEYNAPKQVDWRRTYAGKDKVPFGCNAFYRLLNEDIYRGRMKQQTQTPFNVLLTSPEKRSSYIFINSDVSFSRLDGKYLIQFVEAGNDVLIASSGFWGNPVADTFHIRTDHYFSPFQVNPNDTTAAVSHINFTAPALKAKQPYTYRRGFESGYFSNFDTTKVAVLAYADDTNAVMLRAPMGKGNFYFLSVPDVFSNYFVVNDSARFFAYGAISYLEGEQIWWDEYFKGSGIKSGTPLQFIFASDSLYAAYLITMIALIVFMIFAMKRRQRPIPIVEPLPNATLQFVEVVGSVYYNTRNHKIIAEEKINSFYEFLRAKFLVSSRRADDETLERISKLSAIPLAEIKKLFTQIGMVWRQGSITEKELIELNAGIESFYKNNKR